MKTQTITGIMADFLDSIRAYEHESGKAIHYDERESSEFVDMYFNNEGKLKTEKKKPLFITEDDVKFFSETSREFYIVVNFIKYRSTISDFEDQKKLSHKVYYHESNADEYIWRNKRLFSYEDIREYFECEGKFYDVKSIAKERAEQ